MKKIVYLEDEIETAEIINLLLPYAGFMPLYERCAKKLIDHIQNGGLEPGCHYLLDHVNQTETNPDNISGGYVAMKVMEIDPNAKIIIGTGNSLRDLPIEIQSAVNNGEIGYLQKPFGIKELKEMYN
jgi:FixJ family two-component response regulator